MILPPRRQCSSEMRVHALMNGSYGVEIGSAYSSSRERCYQICARARSTVVTHLSLYCARTRMASPLWPQRNRGINVNLSGVKKPDGYQSHARSTHPDRLWAGIDSSCARARASNVPCIRPRRLNVSLLNELWYIEVPCGVAKKGFHLNLHHLISGGILTREEHASFTAVLYSHAEADQCCSLKRVRYSTSATYGWGCTHAQRWRSDMWRSGVVLLFLQRARPHEVLELSRTTAQCTAEHGQWQGTTAEQKSESARTCWGHCW